MSDKLDAPVTEDENFVNVDPDFANYSNEVDRPLPMPEVEDYNLPEWAREDKDEDSESESDDSDEKSSADAKPSTESTKATTPAPTPAPAVKPVTK